MTGKPVKKYSILVTSSHEESSVLFEQFTEDQIKIIIDFITSQMGIFND